jgi:hypothetical protein
MHNTTFGKRERKINGPGKRMVLNKKKKKRGRLMFLYEQ